MFSELTQSLVRPQRRLLAAKRQSFSSALQKSENPDHSTLNYLSLPNVQVEDHRHPRPSGNHFNGLWSPVQRFWKNSQND